MRHTWIILVLLLSSCHYDRYYRSDYHLRSYLTNSSNGKVFKVNGQPYTLKASYGVMDSVYRRYYPDVQLVKKIRRSKCRNISHEDLPYSWLELK